ncbi:MAG: polyprenyl synthetase family protein [Paenisporosarcina sp.]
MNRNLTLFMKEHLSLIEHELESQIHSLSAPQPLKESMLYSVLAGGKRVRPLFLLAVLDFLNEQHKDAYTIGAAIEMIHTYSLIHDDLPSMDNDDYRRGKLTNHKVFGEALAILAGDALLTYSFGMMSRLENLSAEVKLDLIQAFSQASGAEGMVGGQVLDMESERKKISVTELEFIHKNKTGALLEFSIYAGAILANASVEQVVALKNYARHIGIAFQIQDDILDIEGSSETLGKTAGKDIASDKNTYPALLTLQGAKDKKEWHINLALSSLRSIKEETGILDELATYIINRSN